MKARSIIVSLAIIFIPFIIGMTLFLVKSSAVIRGKAHFIMDTRKNNKGITYKGIKVDWTFCPDWEYKPLFFPAEEYLVFMFHYKNNNDYDVQLMPSYTFASPADRCYSSNEEISMYIEDDLEKSLKADDQTPITFNIPPNASKHYIVTFEKPERLDSFYIDVDVFRDITLVIHYKKENGIWEDYENELVKKYKGRG